MHNQKGFTLVELLIVISLIAVLSVGILSTINPIEQRNKALDANRRNDAGEVLNAYERNYTVKESYPWTIQADAKTIEDEILAQSNTYGFGICNIAAGATGATYDDVVANCTSEGELIAGDELKSSFKQKTTFADLTKTQEAMWVYKSSGSGGGISVCYIPKAKSNRQSSAGTLYCLWEDTDTRVKAGGGGCTVPPTTDTIWGTPGPALVSTKTSLNAIFSCVP